MNNVPDQQMLVLVRAHIETYGDAAANKANERAQALAEIGDGEGAKVWQQIADTIARAG